MAFGAIRKFPIEVTSSLRPQRAIGVSIPFNAPGVFYSTYITKDQLKSNILNYFLTNRGERVFNPTFGSNVRNYIFEQLTIQNYDGLEFMIQEDMKKYFPNVNVNSLEIFGFEDSNTLQVKISYSIKDFGINDQITLTI
jgi:phage baseplate assembly protein W